MASAAFKVFLILKKTMPASDAEKVILFIEDLKDGESVKTDRMIDIYEIFKKTLPASDAAILVNYISDIRFRRTGVSVNA